MTFCWTAWQPYRLSYILGLYKSIFYLPKDHFLKFWWKNVQNWLIWKIDFFWNNKIPENGPCVSRRNSCIGQGCSSTYMVVRLSNKRAKTTKNAFLPLKWPFVGQSDNHVGWATSLTYMWVFWTCVFQKSIFFKKFNFSKFCFIFHYSNIFILSKFSVFFKVWTAQNFHFFQIFHF